MWSWAGRERDWYARLTLVSAIVIWLSVCIFFFRNPTTIAAEPAMYLNCARLVLSGQVPYVDFVPIEWPSTILSALPAAIVGTQFPSCKVLVFNLCSLAFSLATMLLSAAILLPNRHHRQWHYFPPLILALSVINVLLVFQIGQPQYFAFFALFPYLLIRWLNYQGLKKGLKYGRTLSVVCGLLAAAGIALEPLTLLAPLLVEAYFIVTYGKALRVLNGETIACLSGLAFYSCSIILFSNADQHTNFMSMVLPIILTDWQFIDFTTIHKVDAPDRRDVLILGSVLMVAAPIIARGFTLVIPMLFLFMCGLFVLIIEQQGLSRQYVLMMASAIALSGAFIGYSSQWMHRVGKNNKLAFLRRHTVFLLALWILLPLLVSALYLSHLEKRLTPLNWQAIDNKLGMPQELQSFVEKFSKKGDEILFLAKKTFPEFPLLTLLDRSAGSRLLTPGAVLTADRRVANATPAEQDQSKRLRDKLSTMLKDDFASRKPVLVILEQGEMAAKMQSCGITQLLEQEYSHVGTWKMTGANQEPYEFFCERQPFSLYVSKARLQNQSSNVIQSK